VTAQMHPRPGEELDWLAVDKLGRVGLFSTGGQGPVPRALVELLDTVDAAIKRLSLLPALGDSTEPTTETGDYSFWIEPARRGIYGYDWGPLAEGPFARIATPSRPILVDDLTDRFVRDVAELVRLPLDFSDRAYIAASELGVD